LVNDSEYNKFTGTQPIPCRWCIYLVSPGARCCCCYDSCFFLLLLLLGAPTPPRPLYFGGGKYQKNKSPVASALAVGNVCVGVCVVGVGVVGVCVGMVAAFIFLEGVVC
jgi:hypothetical protein